MSRPRGPMGRRLKALRMAVKDPLIEALCALAALRLDRRPRTPEGLDTAPPRNILVIRTDRIGDLVCCSPLIAALHERWPEAQITLVGGRLNRAVMPLLPYLQRSPIEFEPHPVSWARLATWLPRQRFDLAVNLRSEVVSGAWIAVMSGAPVRMIVNTSRTLPAFNLVIGIHDQHQLRRYWRAAWRLGVEWPEPRPIIEVPEDAAERAGSFVRSLALPEGTPLVGVGMPNRSTAEQRVKAWPHEKLVELVRRLAGGGVRVLFFGVGAERAEAETIVARVPGTSLAPPMPLAVVAGTYRHLHLLVSSFTGTLHVADGVGTPTVAIGETYNAADWHPLGSIHRCLSSAHPAEIPVEEVLDAVRAGLAVRLGATVPAFGPS